MTVQVSEVANTQTFGVFIKRLNQMAQLFTSNTVTVNWTGSGSPTTGNAQVNGQFGANVVAVGDGLRGGTVATSGPLSIVSNAVVEDVGGNTSAAFTSNADISVFSLTPNSVIIDPSSNTDIGGTRLNIDSGVMNVTSASFNSNTVLTQTGNTSIKSNTTVTAVGVTGNSTVTNVAITATHLFGSVGIANVAANTLYLRGLNGDVLSLLSNSTNANVALLANHFTLTLANSGLVTGANLTVNTAQLVVNGTTVTVTSNVDANAASFHVNSVNTYFEGTAFVSNANSTFGANLFVAGRLGVGNTAPSVLVQFDSGNASHVPVLALSSNHSLTMQFGNGGIFSDGANTHTAIKGTTKLMLGVGVASGLWVNSTVVGVNSNLTMETGAISQNAGLVHETALSYLSSNTDTQVLDSFPHASWSSAEYLVQTEIEATSKNQLTKVLLVHNGVNTYMTEYGTIASNGTTGVLTANIDGANVNLIITPAGAVTKAVLKRRLLKST